MYNELIQLHKELSSIDNLIRSLPESLSSYHYQNLMCDKGEMVRTFFDIHREVESNPTINLWSLSDSKHLVYQIGSMVSSLKKHKLTNTKTYKEIRKMKTSWTKQLHVVQPPEVAPSKPLPFMRTVVEIETAIMNKEGLYPDEIRGIVKGLTTKSIRYATMSENKKFRIQIQNLVTSLLFYSFNHQCVDVVYLPAYNHIPDIKLSQKCEKKLAEHLKVTYNPPL